MRVDQAVARTYGEALLGAAKGAGKLLEIGEQAMALIESMRENQKLQLFLESPNIADEEKKGLMERTLRGKVDDLLVNFAFLMLARRRVDHFVPALEAFEVLLLEERGLHKAEVTTAVALRENERRELLAAMEAKLGWKLEARFTVDPAVVAGVLFRAEDVLVDSTVRSKLHNLKRRLMTSQIL